jgi:hypothetical protein
MLRSGASEPDISAYAGTISPDSQTCHTESQSEFTQLQDLMVLQLLIVLVLAPCSASFGSATLWLNGSLQGNHAVMTAWLDGWVGYCMGQSLVTPLLLGLACNRQPERPPRTTTGLDRRGSVTVGGTQQVTHKRNPGSTQDRRRGTPINVKRSLDNQAGFTIAAAILLALITLFSSYDHVNLPGIGTVEVPQQLGLPCLIAAVAAAAGEAQLASRARDRDRDRATESEETTAEERKRAAQARERAMEARSDQKEAARRADRSTVLIGRFLLDASLDNRRRLDAFLSLLESVSPR